ncbi:hypothetical protein [Prevotella sp. KH2C16]|uniref:hypothetical protein n=1 Tax=Prevotella sp. KH2C16 TaxID=1855325 RepID=UPI0008E2FE18|nr:hypothetical protein [Prevotella sp. KH2C16]SFG61872.1 hypothetical protein SAMN05216383_12312 [Prevotella sp. KH2C16]
MKRIFYSMIALAITAMTFTSCDDVPMPYNMPNFSETEEPVVVAPTGTGTKEDPFNISAANNYIANGGDANATVYVKGVISLINSIDTGQYGNATYYISDDGKTTTQLEVYRGFYKNGDKFTSEDQIHVGDEVVVAGKLVNFNGTYEFTTGSKIVYQNGTWYETTGGGSGIGTPMGEGTEASPYNVAGVIAKANTLSESDKLENIYATGIVSEIKSFDSGRGQISYYISDDGQKTTQFYVYGGLGKDGAKFTSQDDLKVGQKVIIVGTLLNYKGNTPEFQYGNKIVSIDGEGGSGSGTGTGVTPTVSGTTVTVTNPNVTAGSTTVTIDLNTQGFTNQQEVTSVTLSDGSTITFGKGEGTTTPKFYTATKGVRMYAKNTIDFACKSKIAKIVITCDSYSGTDYTGNPTQTVSFDGTKATYINEHTAATGGVQLRVQTITITYGE